MKDNAVLSDVFRRENVFLTKVYLKMTGALILTAVVAYLVSLSASLMKYVVMNPVSAVIIVIAEFAVVFYLSAKVETMSRLACEVCFALYSVLTGITFSIIIKAYAGTGIITLAFLSTAVVFALAAVYGGVTKKSIKGWGGWLSMMLLGIIITSLINLFIGSSMLDLLICVAGVAIFTLLTAWDSQKLTQLNAEYGYSMTSDELEKISVMGALDLYLDFLNIFLYLIRILALSRNDK